MELAKQTIRDDSTGKVIDEIGAGPMCFTQNNLNDLRETILKGGWTAAQAKEQPSSWERMGIPTFCTS